MRYSHLSICTATLLLCVACGGGGTDPLPTNNVDAPAAAAANPERTPLASAGPLALPASVPGSGGLVADPGLLLLVVGDDAAADDPGITAWQDAASEIGSRVQPIRDAQLTAMGTAGLLQFGGLVLPDQLHSIANDAVVAAVRA